jgi:hypothetical protein
VHRSVNAQTFATVANHRLAVVYLAVVYNEASGSKCASMVVESDNLDVALWR